MSGPEGLLVRLLLFAIAFLAAWALRPQRGHVTFRPPRRLRARVLRAARFTPVAVCWEPGCTVSLTWDEAFRWRGQCGRHAALRALRARRRAS